MERLRPGVSVFEVPGRGSALREASGRLRGVDLPRDTVEALTRWFDGVDPVPPPGLDPERGAFAAAGYLDETPAPRTATVTVAGRGALADAVAAALAGPGMQVRRRDLDSLAAVLVGETGTETDTETGIGTDAVCAVADGPAPAAWTALDILPAHGTAWFRLAVEGRHGILEPPAVHPGDAGHADVRARRLAAAGSGHPHLLAYWDAAPAAPTGPGDHALLAALLAADIRAWIAGHDTPATGDLVPAALPARRRLRVVDLDTAAIADHALLPVPDSAP
ncbi:hypothetical protein Ae406Ps2_1745c [Pseudonocardia sp. Ae406_Ps2]|nr:hypothetical protein Ae406Ps2_1745c [Pseudonocardia sp. Ae406_Ps2]OLM06472.1 hypothetical protein Ae331Ps2_4182 [Pseudonocardia sp. Ae331_Ps2]OLM23315.1 hypothetical protein Ae706Ps2_1748c [Pseudonocardia sp. Ae706_Ps2]OLM32373.1 hypothetical protein Ae717Ps2_3268c [Pseudonocardia sp. Ae717_Ps2]